MDELFIVDICGSFFYPTEHFTEARFYCGVFSIFPHSSSEIVRFVKGTSKEDKFLIKEEL